MNDDLNSERSSDRPADGTSGGASAVPVDALAQELQELLKGSSVPVNSTMAGLPNLISCPKLGDWLHLAIGAAGPTEVDVLLTHAAICSACAVRLRQSLRLLAEEASSEETAEVSNLPSASREWQHQLAVELAHSPLRPRRGRAWGWYLWAGSALAASLVLAGGLTLWWQHMNTPERLLAEAYTHDRIFNLRMPGSGFAEVTPETHLRGGASGHESSRLLDARARIERHLENAPEDPHWLQLEGRADVLEEKFDPAIDIFDRLLVAGPVTSSLLTDDASAYFQRGTVTGSENDRATALDYLRRADELAPGDTLVLFNEAVVMEDRGQVMNTVETWNRYLRFERDPRWLAEGRRRLQALEQKLNQLKTHQSRMEQHLATPQAMLSLAADPATLNALDEELSSSLLPKLLGSAFPLPLDRSRGSPCERSCQAARTLLHALADSLQHNHQDPWLNRFLPTASTSPNLKFTQAAQALGKAIDADVTGDYLPARKWALQATRIFRGLGNAAGEDRAEVERSYALLRSSDIPGCYGAIHPLLERDPQFAWIHIHVLTQDALCDSSPGSAAENNPSFLRAISLAYDRRYTLLELRARILLGAAAVDSGDAEASWRIYLPTVRRFYTGDYPPIRLYNTLSGLEEVEESTPRLQSTLLLQKEVVGVLELTPARQLIPTERFKLASVAIRAGAVPEAQHQMRLAEAELAANGGGESVKGFLAENEMAMADLYLARHDLSAAAKILDAARGHIAGERNTYHRRDYAVDYGQLELALGHPEAAESMVRDAVLEDERLAAKGGAENITLAQQDRDLYAILAGLWVAQGRPGEDILALWERYRLRILGKPVPICAGRGLACLQPQLSSALKKLGPDRVLGQIVLSDRVLLYRANAQGVVFGSISVGKDDLLAAIRPLERAASSPATSQDSVDYAARRVGEMLLGGGNEPPVAAGQLLLEPDPILGNLPWPAVETSAGPIGLQFDLAELPSLLLSSQFEPLQTSRFQPGPLVVGASVTPSEDAPLPEALEEAKAVASFGQNSNLLLASQATEAGITMRLATASAFHFAGHATQQDGATRLLLASATVPAALRPALSSADKPYMDSEFLRKHPPRSARLAVFSACSTGKREEGWDHGMGDIVDTLASLGVPEVVATRWQIDSSSAVSMMDAFYSGLARGYTVSHALTAARQSLIRDARHRHPYYWAAYYASGSGKSNLSQIFRTSR